MATIKHLESKYSTATYELIKVCEGDELRFYLWLKLWAINKHSAFPGYDTITKDIGIARRTLSRLIERMEKSGRLKIERSHGRNNIYDITWYDRLVVPEVNSTSAITEPQTSAKSEPKLKEIITKRNNKLAAPSAAIDLRPFIDAFEPVNPSYERMFKNTTERAALTRLITKYTPETVSKWIAALPKIITQEYAPQITTPYQLERKLGQLMAFLTRKKNQSPKVITV